MSDSAAGPAAPQPAGQRLHPAGLLVGFVTNLPQLFVPIAAVVLGGDSISNATPLLVAAILGGSFLLRWLSWLRFRYFIGEDDVRIERGIFSRNARSIPYDRIADISVEQKPLARLFALGEVKIETGGGKGEDASLSFVSLAEAERLRETVRARKAADGSPDPAVSPEESAAAPIFAMDTRRLLTLGFYSFSLVIFAVLAGAAQQFDFLLPFDPWDLGRWIGLAQDQGMVITQIARSSQLWGAVLGLAGLILIGFATGIGRTVLTEYGFRLDRTAKGFRRRRGLLTLTDVVIPTQRVQAAQIGTGPIRLRRGWHWLKFVSLASEGKRDSHHMIAPLARLTEIWPIIAEAGLHQPGAELQFEAASPGPWIDAWLIELLLLAAGLGIAAYFIGPLVWWGLLLAPLRALAGWFSWRHHAHATDQRQLYARHGWWNQQLEIARQLNVQSVSISQGPLLRRRGLAAIEFGIAGGKLSFQALPLAAAQAIRDQVLAIAGPVDYSQLGGAG